ncbi:hypothetical protein EDC94DRAFT_660721 [Helicostylum pulchrum]|nr:hypothetical protein EDC94DRAFT_660721 [Helicostylum pulchrum]
MKVTAVYKDIILGVDNHYSQGHISKWLSSYDSFGQAKTTRRGNKTVKARGLWVLKPNFIGDALEKLYNRTSFITTVKKTKGFITVGYFRKSPSNELAEIRIELLQKKINSLRLNDLCEKVFVSPTCISGSTLSKKDRVPTKKSKKVTRQFRFFDGDMQDLVMFSKTGPLSLRLVVLDYAGLSTDPKDKLTPVLVKLSGSVNLNNTDIKENCDLNKPSSSCIEFVEYSTAATNLTSLIPESVVQFHIKFDKYFYSRRTSTILGKDSLPTCAFKRILV